MKSVNAISDRSASAFSSLNSIFQYFAEIIAVSQRLLIDTFHIRHIAVLSNIAQLVLLET
jgi:hypothetical protein